MRPPSFRPWLVALVTTVIIGVTLALVAPVHATSAIDPLPFKDHAQEVRFQKLTGQMHCMVCQDESLANSNAELARQMRQIVFDKMQQGWSNDRIKQYFVARYSDYVLYKPPLKPSTWLLWFGPIAILLAGGAAVAVVIRKHRRGAPEFVPDDDTDDW